MAYETLLVHVDASHEGRARVRNAVDLAVRTKARLIGPGAAAIDFMPDRTGMTQRLLQEWTTERLQAAEAVFREEVGDLTEAEWRARVQLPAHALADVACAADLIVASRTAELTAAQLFPSPHELVLTAGAPVLLQPANAPPLAAKRIVVGWKNTREARRALADALPLLIAAEEVRLVRFERDGETGPDPSLELVRDRLQRRGVPIVLARPTRSAPSVGEDLIAAAHAAGGDLIVAGAYGQSRLQELVLGGVTRSLITHAPVYVLFSH